MKRLNFKFLIILFALAGILGIGGMLAYKIQKKRSVAALLIQARAAEKAGDRAKAEGLYAHYLGFRSDDSATMTDYGLMLASGAESPQARVKALAVLEQAIRRNPNRSDLRREVIRIAMDRTVQQYSRAREQIEALLSKSPDDGELKFQAGRCHEGERDYQQAIDCYAEAIALAPSLIEGYVLQAKLLRARLAKPVEADKVLDQMVERNPGSFRAHLERGNQRRIGGSKGAEQDIIRAVELAPDDVDVLASSAELAIDRGDLEEARRLASRCLKLRPTDGRLYDLAYRAETRANRPDEAKAILDNGINAKLERGDRIRLLLRMADLQIFRENYPEADEAIKKIGELDVRPELVNYYKAQVLAGRGQWRSAAKILEEIRARFDDLPEMAYNANVLLALCCERLGEQDRRYSAYSRAINLKPLDLRCQLGLAETLVASGRVEESISQYRKIEGDFPQVRTNLARMLILRNLRRPAAERDWSEVDRTLAAAEATSPDGIEVKLLRAEVLANRGRFDDSQNELKALAGRFPKSDAPWISRIELALKQGRQQMAAELLDQANRIGLGDSVGMRLARADVLATAGGEDVIEALDRLSEGIERLTDLEKTTLLRGLAEAHRRSGDLPGTRRILDRLNEQSPDDFPLQLNRFELAFQSNDAPGMKSIIDAIGDKEEVTARLARARYLTWLAAREGRNHEGARNELAEARNLLSLASSQRPGWLPVVLAAAYIDDLSENHGDAVRGYLQAIDLGQREPEIVIRAIELLVSRGRYDQADEIVRKMTGDGATIKEPKFYRLAAEVALRQKDFARALAYASKVIEPGTEKPADLLWRARLLWAAGKKEQAEPDLRKAVASAGEADAPEAWLSLVTYLASTGRRPQAEEAIEQARLKLPERGKSTVLARCFAMLNQRDKAREHYRAAVKAGPDDPATLRMASDVALRIGETEDAKEYLRKLEARRAESPSEAAQARRTLGVLLAAGGDRKGALNLMGLIDDGLPYRPATDESVEDLRAKSKVLILRGGRRNRRATLEILATIMGRDQASPEDRFLMAQVLELDGDWPKARAQMQVLLADSGNSPEFLAFYIRGLLRHDEGRGAGPSLEKLEKADPASFQTVELKARLAHSEKRPEAAAKLLTDFVRSNPAAILQVALLFESFGQLSESETLFGRYASQVKQPESILPLAAFVGRRKRVAEALDLCDSAWKSGRPEVVSQASVSVLYASAVNEEACRRVAGRIEEAIRRSPEKMSLQFDLANVEILQRKSQEAEEIFRKIYEKDRENAASANNLAWLLTIQDGKASEAVTLLDQTIERSGPAPMLLDTRGTARMALDQVAAAVEDLEEATNSGPSATRFFHLAGAYLKANRPQEAKEALREANVLGLEEDKLHPLERPVYRRLVAELAGG